MMKKILLLTFFLHAAASIKAQNYRITRGQEFTSASPADKDLLLNGDSTGFYLINDPELIKEGGCKLYKFDPHTSGKLFEKDLQFSYDGELNIVAGRSINGRIYLFFQSINKKEQKVHLLLREFYSSNGQEIGQARLIDQFEPTFDTDLIKFFTVSFSPDESKVLLLREVFSDSREQIIHIKVCSAKDFSSIWEMSANSGSEDQLPTGYDYRLNNAGVFCYLWKDIEDVYAVQILSGKYENKRSVPLTFANCTVLNPALELVDNRMICSGEVLEGMKKSKFDDQANRMGFFLAELDVTAGELGSQSIDYFNEDLQKKLGYKDKHYYYKFEGIDSRHYGNKTYQHYKTFFLNGCFYLVKSHSYVYTEENMFGQLKTYPGQNEIIVFKYKDFKLDWMRLIPGKNFSVRKKGIHYILSGDLHFIYYDNPSNLRRLTDIGLYDYRKYSRMKNGSAKLVGATIEENGNVRREVLGTDKDYYLPLDYAQSFQIRTKATVVTTWNRKKRRFDLIQKK